MTDKTLVERLRNLAEEWFEMCDDIHEPLNEAATRIEALEAALRIAAKAERDRIVAWLRSDKPDRDNGGPCRHVEHSQGTCICNELADALESQP